MKRTRRRPRFVSASSSSSAGPVSAVTLPEPKLYFDTVKEDAVGLVVRHLSSRPHLDSWMKNVNAKDALIMIGTDGVLGKVSRDMFTELSYKLWYNFGSNELTRALYTEDSELYYSLLREQSSKLKALSFRWDNVPLKVDAYQPLFKACRQVRVLVINDRSRGEPSPGSISRLLSVCGDTLHELQIYGDVSLRGSTVRAISRHCDSLVSLSLSHSSCNVPLKPMFYAIGRTLRTLHFSIKSPTMSDQSALSSIRAYCPRLEDVLLSHTNCIPLLYHLNAGLRIIRFDQPYVCPDLAQLETLFELCPNCAVDANLVGVPYNPEPFLAATGERLSALNLRHWFEPSGDFSEVSSSMHNLVNLTLGFGPTSRSYVESFFTKPKVHLRKLSLDDTKTHYVQYKAHNIVHETSTVRILLDILANTVNTLEELQIKTSDTINDKDSERFLRANKKLHRIIIKYETLYDTQLRLEREQLTAEFLRGIKPFSNVNEIEIEDSSMKQASKKIADACVLLRSEQLVVVAGTTQYLPTINEKVYH